jgi:hypothetical protein
VVTFRIDGVDQVEMMPPALLRASIVRRLAVMADLPTYPSGGSAKGEIILAFDHRPEQPRFAVRVSGHGGRLTATLDILEGYQS